MYSVLARFPFVKFHSAKALKRRGFTHSSTRRFRSGQVIGTLSVITLIVRLPNGMRIAMRRGQVKAAIINIPGVRWLNES